MTPKQTEAFIKKQLDRWGYLVTSYGWRFTAFYVPNGNEMPDGHESATACTNFSPMYLEGFIHFNIHKCAKLPLDRLEEVVIHKITHMIVAPMDDLSREKNADVERVVTQLSRILKGLRKSSKKGKRN